MTKPHKILSKDRVLGIFVYIGGRLFNRHHRSDNAMEGASAGCLNSSDGYKYVKVDGRHWAVHRLVYLMHHGHLPEYIDHINGVRDDNRIENLRACTSSENNCNKGRRRDNKSGVKGVSWHKASSKWIVQLKFKGNYHYLGLFEDIELAALVVTEAREVLHGEFAKQ